MQKAAVAVRLLSERATATMEGRIMVSFEFSFFASDGYRRDLHYARFADVTQGCNHCWRAQYPGSDTGRSQRLGRYGLKPDPTLSVGLRALESASNGGSADKSDIGRSASNVCFAKLQHHSLALRNTKARSRIWFDFGHIANPSDVRV